MATNAYPDAPEDELSKVTHDLTTNTWWLEGVGIVLFFLIFFLTVQIYDQSKEIVIRPLPCSV
jgi:hypothetical protein